MVIPDKQIEKISSVLKKTRLVLFANGLQSNSIVNEIEAMINAITPDNPLAEGYNKQMQRIETRRERLEAITN